MEEKTVLQKFLIVLMVLSCIVLVGCFFARNGTKSEYIIEKGHQASQRIKEIRAFGDSDYESSKFKDIESLRRNYVFGMIGSVVVFFACLYMYTSAKKVKATPEMHSSYMPSSSQKIAELYEMRNKGLITPSEYEQKRKDILNKM